MINNQIHTFILVVEIGSFSKAAQKLYLSPVAIMKQINELEDRVGEKLLDRTSKGVSMTAAGQEFYKESKRLVVEADSIIKKIKEHKLYQDKVLYIGVSDMHSGESLMEVLFEAGDALHFRLEIVQFNDAKSMINQLGKKIDCTVGPYCDGDYYNTYQLGTQPSKLAVSRRSPLARKKELTWEDLDGQSIMLKRIGISSNHDQIRSEIEKNHPKIQIVDMDAYDTEAFNICEKNNYLMETVDLWAVSHFSLVTIPMQWKFNKPYGIVYANNPSPVMQEFINILKKLQNNK